MVAERAVYVGDLHGFPSRLDNINKQKIDAIYFVGDVSGSGDMNNLKELYNQIYHGVGIAIQNEKKDLVSQLGDAFDKTEEIKAKLLNVKMPVFSDEVKNKKLQEILRYSSYTKYLAKLPIDVREKLDLGVRIELDKIIEWNNKVVKDGIRVAMISGNWDENLGTVEYLRNGGVNIYDDYAIIENKNILILMAPYGVVNTGMIDQKILNKINLEKSRGSKIIMITHVPPKLRIHEETTKRESTYEMKQQVRAANKVVFSVLPDELVYGHVHTRLKQNNRFVSYREAGIDMVYCAYREIKLRV